MDVKKNLFDNFNEFINKQDVEPFEVCKFIYSLLKESGYSYTPTKCKIEWVLKDSCE